jgi:hypothetical protein
MREILRTLFTLICALSLVVFTTIFIFWVRSYKVMDTFERSGLDGDTSLTTSIGVIRFYHEARSGFALAIPDDMLDNDYRHKTLRPPRIFHEPMWMGQRVTFDRCGFVLWRMPNPNSLGVADTWGLNVPCWAAAGMFALLPLYWFLVFRHGKPRNRRRGFDVVAPLDEKKGSSPGSENSPFNAH